MRRRHKARRPARRHLKQGLAEQRAAGARDGVAAKQGVVDRDIGSGGARQGAVQFAIENIVARRQAHRAVGVGLGRYGIVITDRPRHQHRDRVIFGNGDHIDAALVDIALFVRRTRRAAAVGDDVAALGPDQHIDVEQAAVDADVGLFGGDIGRRAIDAHGARLDDARRNNRDIAAARIERIVGVDRRTVRDGDRRDIARRAAKADFACRTQQAAGRDDVVGGQHQAADVDRGAIADQDAAGVIEPDMAILQRRQACDRHDAVHRPVQRDLVRDRGARRRDKAVEHDVVDGVADKIEGVSRRQKIDDAADGRIGRRPVDDALRSVHIDRRRVHAGTGRRPGGQGGDRPRPRHLRQRRSAIGQRHHARADRAAGQQAPFAVVVGRGGGGGTHGVGPRYENHQRAFTPNWVVSDTSSRGSGFWVRKPPRFSGTAIVTSSRATSPYATRIPPPAE